jgi:hypothetical protein
MIVRNPLRDPCSPSVLCLPPTLERLCHPCTSRAVMRPRGPLFARLASHQSAWHTSWRRLGRMCERTHLHTPPHTRTHTQHTRAHTYKTHAHIRTLHHTRHSRPRARAPLQIPKSKWVPDKERPNCRTCRSEFNRLNRRCVTCLLLMQRPKCAFAQAACGWLAG